MKISDKQKMDQRINQRLYFMKQLAKYKLSEQERHDLINIILQYQANKLVEKFVEQLVVLLAPENKLHLMKDIRHIVYRHHLNYFDQLLVLCLQMRSSSTPDKIPPQNFISNTHKRSKTVPLIFSTDDVHSNSHNSLRRKTRTVYNESSNMRNWTLPNKLVKASKFKVVNFCQPDKFEDLGFSICGGKENNACIYVGYVNEDGPAAKTELIVGDVIVEVNGVCLENMSLNSAGKLLKNLRKIKLIVRTNDWLYNKRKFVSFNPWTGEEKIASEKVESKPLMLTPCKSITERRKDDHLTKPFVNIQNKELNDSASERYVKLALDNTQAVGFSIRGGSEFGVGIFISSIDSGSAADKGGLKAGDLILAVNERDFQNVSHSDAVKFVKSQKYLNIRLMSVGKIPEGRQLVHEYSWLNTDGRRETSRSASPSPTLPARSVSQLSTFTNTINEITDIPFDSKSPNPTISVESVETQVSERNFVRRKDASIQVCEETTKLKDMTSTAQKTETFDRSPHEIKRVVNDFDGDEIEALSGAKRATSFTDLTDLNETFKEKQLDRQKFGSLDTLCDSKSFFRRQGDKILKALSTKKKNRSHEGKRKSLFASVLFDDPEDKMKSLDWKLQETMTVADYKQITVHLNDYLGKGDVELFVVHVLDLVGIDDKHGILPYIRNIVRSQDIARFDKTVAKHHSKRRPSRSTTPVLHDTGLRHNLDISFESPTNRHDISSRKSQPIVINTSEEKRDEREVKDLDYSSSKNCVNTNMLGSMRQIPQPSLMYTGMLQPDVLRYGKIQNGAKRSGKRNSIDFSSFLNDDDFQGLYPFGSCDLPPAKLNIMNKKNYRTQKVSTFRDILPNKKDRSKMFTPSGCSSEGVKNEEGLKDCYVYSPRYKQIGTVEPPQNLSAFFAEDVGKNEEFPQPSCLSSKQNPLDDFIFDDEKEEYHDVSSTDHRKNVEDLYSTVDKTYRRERVNHARSQVKVSDSFTSYDVATSMSANDENNKTVSIRNVKINKPNKVYEFSPDGVGELRNTSLSSGISSCDNSLFSEPRKICTDYSYEGPAEDSFHEVKLSKDHECLGLSISGGSDIQKQRDVKIYSISPDSAASKSSLTSGQVLISVDGESLVDVTHKEAVQLLRMKFKDKSTDALRLVVANQ